MAQISNRRRLDDFYSPAEARRYHPCVTTRRLDQDRAQPDELEEARAQIAELEESVEALGRLRSLFAMASDGILILSGDGRLMDANESFARMHGYSADELKHMELADLDTPEAFQRAPERIRRILAGEVLQFELEHRHRDGHVFPLEVSASLISASGERFIQAFHRDITERKQAEEEKAGLEAQLQQAQKMESVGRLAGGVAHDFNKTLAGMLKMLQRVIGEDILLSCSLGESVWPVKVDPSQIDQMLANLCVNARDAISGVGKLSIETGNSTFDEDYCAAHAAYVPGDYVRLAVSDDGCGMDPETLSHVFEPFFTTKSVGAGTGLGLSTVYGAVKQNHGFITVSSEPGQGTTFTIYLPRYVGNAVPARAESAEDPALRGRETILLVEDEPVLLGLVARLLEAQGYTVLRASSPGEAIRLAREHASEIHLLVTDVVMPEMNGRDLANSLSSLRPSLKHLFMSGYMADVIAPQGVLDDGVFFLQKPFSTKELAATVRRALDSGGS